MNIPGGSTIIYIIAGILIAFFINTGLGLILSTPMPIVAVESESMVPTLNVGDILILQGTAKDELNISDIIVFLRRDVISTPIVHRLIKINNDETFQTKGDANKAQHSWEKNIIYEQIQGKVIFIIPYLGLIKIKLVEILFPIFPNTVIIISLIIILILIYIYKR